MGSKYLPLKILVAVVAVSLTCWYCGYRAAIEELAPEYRQLTNRIAILTEELACVTNELTIVNTVKTVGPSPTLVGDDWVDHESVEPGGPVSSTPRSPLWRTVRAKFICDGHDTCLVCGTKIDLNVHHVVPFHERPDLELDHSNLVTLCREHHFTIGHDPDGDGPIGPSWRHSNPNVRRDAKKLNPLWKDCE